MEITGLALAKVLSLNLAEIQSISSNNYSYNYGWPQILTRQYIIIIINSVSPIFGLVSNVIVSKIIVR